MIKIKNESRLHLVTYNQNQIFTFHIISCCISRHFMLHFTSFHIAFHIFHYTHCTHCMHITHVAHFAFHAHRTFHALPYIARHFMYHFMSFYHENLFHSYSYYLGLKREEIWSKCHTLQ